MDFCIVKTGCFRNKWFKMSINKLHFKWMTSLSDIFHHYILQQVALLKVLAPSLIAAPWHCSKLLNVGIWELVVLCFLIVPGPASFLLLLLGTKFANQWSLYRGIGKVRGTRNIYCIFQTNEKQTGLHVKQKHCIQFLWCILNEGQIFGGS